MYNGASHPAQSGEHVVSEWSTREGGTRTVNSVVILLVVWRCTRLLGSLLSEDAELREPKTVISSVAGCAEHISSPYKLEKLTCSGDNWACHSLSLFWTFAADISSFLMLLEDENRAKGRERPERRVAVIGNRLAAGRRVARAVVVAMCRAPLVIDGERKGMQTRQIAMIDSKRYECTSPVRT